MLVVKDVHSPTVGLARLRMNPPHPTREEIVVLIAAEGVLKHPTLSLTSKIKKKHLCSRNPTPH